jgi:hypothetical protein
VEDVEESVEFVPKLVDVTFVVETSEKLIFRLQLYCFCAAPNAEATNDQQ